MGTKTIAQRRKAEPLPATGYSDDTGDRIRAFMTSVRPRTDGGAAEEVFALARPLIERIALSAKGIEHPAARLSREQCVQILELFTKMEPVEDATWWDDPKDAPSHVCGFHFVLFTLMASLQEGNGDRSATNNTTPTGTEHAKEPPSLAPLVAAADLLRVALQAWGESGDPDCERSGILEVVRLSREHLEAWFADERPPLGDLRHDSERNCTVYDALDLVHLVEFALQNDSEGSAGGLRTCRYVVSPIRGGMSSAARMLESILEDESSEEDEEAQP